MENRGLTKLDATWDRVIEVWWGCLWRFVIFVLLPGMVIGYFFAILATFIMGPMVGALMGKIALFVVTALLSIPLCKLVLETKFRSFSVGLVAEPPGEPTPSGHDGPN